MLFRSHILRFHCGTIFKNTPKQQQYKQYPKFEYALKFILAGSFDGLALWDRNTGKSIDYLTKLPITPHRPGPPRNQLAVTGYTADFLAGDVAFGYSFGARYIHRNGQFIPMTGIESPDRISLWHLALEVHTGRIYKPLLGFFSDLFVFISGIILSLITITGFVMYRRRKRRSGQNKK